MGIRSRLWHWNVLKLLHNIYVPMLSVRHQFKVICMPIVILFSDYEVAKSVATSCRPTAAVVSADWTISFKDGNLQQGVWSLPGSWNYLLPSCALGFSSLVPRPWSGNETRASHAVVTHALLLAVKRERKCRVPSSVTNAFLPGATM